LVEPKVEAAGIEPAQDSPGRQTWLPTGKLLERYPESLPYLLHHAPLDYYRAGGLDLRPLYAEAQGTATTFLYAIQADAPSGPIKIGVAIRPEARLEQLQIGCPYPLTLVASIPATVRIERQIHKHLAPHRKAGEWFAPDAPVLELVAELFEIGLMAEDYLADGCELALAGLAALMADSLADEAFSAQGSRRAE
jgi:hypothetical protein